MNLPKLKLQVESLREGNILSSIGEYLVNQTSKVFDNEAIIRQTIIRDPEQGFEMIYKKYFNQLCSHSIRYVYSTQVAEDIVSEVFLGFWRNKLYITVKSTFRAYLLTAVRNRSIDYVKAEFGIKEAKAKEEAAIKNHSDMNDPQSILLTNELMNKISDSINGFSP